MEVLFFVWSVLSGWWSIPNLEESKDRFKTTLSFLIFAPVSTYCATKAFGGYGVLSFVPLAFRYITAHPIALWANTYSKR